MKKIFLIILVISFSQFSFCQIIEVSDSTNIFKYNQVEEYIKSDTNLLKELIESNIKEICITNVIAAPSNQPFLKDIIDIKFPNLDSLNKANIFWLVYSYESNCSSDFLFRNLYLKNTVRDNCEAILIFSSFFNDFIRTDVLFVNKNFKEKFLKNIYYESNMIYSYLFYFKDNMIDTVINEKIYF